MYLLKRHIKIRLKDYENISLILNIDPLTIDINIKVIGNYLKLTFKFAIL